MLLDDILSLLSIMYEHEVYYTDVDENNFVIWNNQIKVIDFDPYLVTFNDRYTKLTRMLERYLRLLNRVLDKYQLPRAEIENIQNFKEAKILTMKIENGVRKNK